MLKNILFFASLFAALPALAQTPPARFEITPFGAYSFGGTFNDIESDLSLKLDDSASYGLIFDFREGYNTQWEVLYSKQSTEARASGLISGDPTLDVDIHYLQGGGTYQGDGQLWRPYLAATIGAAHFNVRTPGYNSDTFFSFSLAPGLQFRPNERVGLRLEARLYGTLVRSDSALFCVSDPAGGTDGCAITIAGEVLWQLQAMAGIVFRF